MSKSQNSISGTPRTRKRRLVDLASSVGFILLAAGLFLPVFDLFNLQKLSVFKWIYTAGALIFLGSKCVPVLPKDTSLRLKRMYRLEFWAGVCFCVGAAFWFYNQSKFAGSAVVGPLTIIHDTILYAMSGAVVEVIAVWLIYYREKKEAREQAGVSGRDKKA